MLNQSDKLILFAATFHAVCHHGKLFHPVHRMRIIFIIAKVFICLPHRSHDTAVFVLDYLHKSFLGSCIVASCPKRKYTETTATTTGNIKLKQCTTTTMIRAHKICWDVSSTSCDNFHFSNLKLWQRQIWNDYAKIIWYVYEFNLPKIMCANNFCVTMKRFSLLVFRMLRWLWLLISFSSSVSVLVSGAILSKFWKLFTAQVFHHFCAGAKKKGKRMLFFPFRSDDAFFHRTWHDALVKNKTLVYLTENCLTELLLVVGGVSKIS